MAYDEGVAQRLREAFADRYDVGEKKMFGGIAFMVAGYMCCGVSDDALMARVGPDRYEWALERQHVREMDFTGRPLRGYVFVDPAGFEDDEDLEMWVEVCESFVRSLPPK